MVGYKCFHSECHPSSLLPYSSNLYSLMLVDFEGKKLLYMELVACLN